MNSCLLEPPLASWHVHSFEASAVLLLLLLLARGGRDADLLHRHG